MNPRSGMISAPLIAELLGSDDVGNVAKVGKHSLPSADQLGAKVIALCGNLQSDRENPMGTLTSVCRRDTSTICGSQMRTDDAVASHRRAVTRRARSLPAL